VFRAAGLPAFLGVRCIFKGIAEERKKGIARKNAIKIMRVCKVFCEGRVAGGARARAGWLLVVVLF
jgi:hypothetical protein